MKSVQQHIQDGTYQKCRHADRGITVAPVTGLSCPPTIKNKDVRKLWEQQVGALCENELVTIVDAPELEHAYYCYQKAMECRKKLETFKDAASYYSSLKFHEKDLTAEYRKWMHEYEKVLYKFGMTPVEASKVRTNKKPGDEGDEILKEILALGS